MPKSYSRPLSPPECGHIVFDEISPPLVNQIVFEGNGQLDISDWQLAVKKASEANPGSRLVLHGHLGGCRWIDSGIVPPVSEIDGSEWDGMSYICEFQV